MKKSLELIDDITKIYDGEYKSDLNDMLKKLRIIIKKEVLNEMLKAIETIDDTL
jgi:hypothetical protein